MPKFDPYHHWLGVPPSEQPPNHYRLLGLPPFESDLDVIDTAAERQTVFLRTLQIGPQAELAEQILNEVARARVTLLHAARKSAYDEALRAEQSKRPPPVSIMRSPGPSTTIGLADPDRGHPASGGPLSAGQIEIKTGDKAVPPNRRRPSVSGTLFRSLLGIVVGGIAGICFGILLLHGVWGLDPFGLFENRTSSTHRPSEPGHDRPPNTETEEVPKSAPGDEPPNTDNRTDSELAPGDDPPNTETGEVPVAAPGDHGPLPVPEQALLNEARSALHDQYDPVYQTYKTGDDSPVNSQRSTNLSKLAADIQSSHSSAAKPATRFAALEMAIRIATESGHVSQTVSMIDDFAQQFAIEDLDYRVAAASAWSEPYTRHPNQAAPEVQAKELLNFIAALKDRATAEQRAVDLATLEQLRRQITKADVLPHPSAKTRPARAVAGFDREKAEGHQKAWAEYLDISVSFQDDLGILFVLIPPGEFTMGSPPLEQDRDHNGHHEFAHRVAITTPFYLGTYEVTQQQYEKQMTHNPSYFSREGVGAHYATGSNTAQFPVENVSWSDVDMFCRRRSDKERVKYRLPTEAEWEYARRAGTEGAYGGTDHVARLRDSAWFGDNSNGRKLNSQRIWDRNKDPGAYFEKLLELGCRPHAVGALQPNAWGIYDMPGNVFEWCHDWYAEYDPTPGIANDPQGPDSGDLRVLRGGCAFNYPSQVRSASRSSDAPSKRYLSLGFRLVRTIPQAGEP